eukprot:214458-Chlamydomonas_euryale.AAC.5
MAEAGDDPFGGTEVRVPQAAGLCALSELVMTFTSATEVPAAEAPTDDFGVPDAVSDDCGAARPRMMRSCGPDDRLKVLLTPAGLPAPKEGGAGAGGGGYEAGLPWTTGASGYLLRSTHAAHPWTRQVSIDPSCQHAGRAASRESRALLHSEQATDDKTVAPKSQSPIPTVCSNWSPFCPCDDPTSFCAVCVTMAVNQRPVIARVQLIVPEDACG